ncbi:MAG TPA: hypothetical protein VIU46_10625 [Gallionellaceae bacterium]
MAEGFAGADLVVAALGEAFFKAAGLLAGFAAGLAVAGFFAAGALEVLVLLAFFAVDADFSGAGFFADAAVRVLDIAMIFSSPKITSAQCSLWMILN